MPGKRDASCAAHAEIWTAAIGSEWLKEHGQEAKENLKKSRGLSKEEYINKMGSSSKLMGIQQ